MAVVLVYSVPFSIPWPNMGSGEVRVYAEDTGNQSIDRVEIDNSQSDVNTRVLVQDQQATWELTTLIDVTLAPGDPVAIYRDQSLGGPIPNNDRWRQGTKGANPVASKYLISTSHWQ